MSPTQRLPTVFTAQSKVYFYCRFAVCEYVFQHNAIPLNPFCVFDYFLGDRVERDLVRQGNNNLIQIADAIWIFGNTIADGVLFEILFAKKIAKPIRYFTIDNRAKNIREIGPKDLQFEKRVYAATGLKRDELIAQIIGPNHADELIEQILIHRRDDRSIEQLSLFPDDAKT